MNAPELRQAAALLRNAWFPNEYCKRVGDKLAMCIMGSIAKVAQPSLTEESRASEWERAAERVLEENPTVALALAAVCEPRLMALTDPRRIRTRDRAYPGYNMVGIRVCLTNVATVKDGEDAASLVEQAADLVEAAED